MLSVSRSQKVKCQLWFLSLPSLLKQNNLVIRLIDFGAVAGKFAEQLITAKQRAFTLFLNLGLYTSQPLFNDFRRNKEV